jgi:regulator of protease activity HflC (stomatin/prohibitin superfamily)
VIGPGLHFGLPLPFGIVRRTELGAIHQIAIMLPGAGTAERMPADEVENGEASSSAGAGAEGPAPYSADRLWDQSHPSEGTYLIARESDARQNFEAVDIDVRLVYRIGLADEAAKAAVYNTVEPERLIRATAGRFLARYFATRTLLAVLGEDRQTFANLFRDAIQAELDGLSTGLEMVAVIVEAIHPPPGAATAYHYVQAAGINAQVAIAGERASAVQSLKLAALDATRQRNDAAARAIEATSKAGAESKLFEADRTSNSRNPSSFILERWFARLATSLDKKSLLLVDHRMLGRDVPTLDLRDAVGFGADPIPKSR